jgi:hypothetical protein
MKNIICRLTVFFLLIISANAAEDWQKVVEKKFNFSFLSPGKITKEIDSLEDEGRKAFIYTWYIENRDTNDQNLYSIQVIDNLDEVISDSSNEYIAELLALTGSANFSDTAGYETIIQKRSEIEGYLGQISKYINKNTELSVALFNFAVKNRLYSFFTMQGIDELDNDNSRKFINNINLEGVERGRYKASQASSKSLIKAKFNQEPFKREEIVNYDFRAVPLKLHIDTSIARYSLLTFEYDFSEFQTELNDEESVSGLLDTMQLEAMNSTRSIEQERKIIYYKNILGKEYTTYSDVNKLSTITRFFYKDSRVFGLAVVFTTPEIDRKVADDFFNSMEIIGE